VQCEYCCGSFDCVVCRRRPNQHMQPDPAITSLWFTILAGLILYLCLSVGIRLGAQTAKRRAQLIGRRVLLAWVWLKRPVGVKTDHWPSVKVVS
jgi:hypothetical protein